MDIMIEHPWSELQVLIKEKWLTQKAFSYILWKKVSEVNELLKWKRNITIQRDYLLHQTLWTPIKYWILKQVDYDYSLLDIEETSHNDAILSDSEESISDNEQNIQQPLSPATQSSSPSREQKPENKTFSPDRGSGEAEGVITQETPVKEHNSKDDEDLKNRAKIFRSF